MYQYFLSSHFHAAAPKWRENVHTQNQLPTKSGKSVQCLFLFILRRNNECEKPDSFLFHILPVDGSMTAQMIGATFLVGVKQLFYFTA